MSVMREEMTLGGEVVADVASWRGALVGDRGDAEADGEAILLHSDTRSQ